MNQGLNRYKYPASPAHCGNGVVNHSLSKLLDSVRGPVLSRTRSDASTFLPWALSPNVLYFNLSYLLKRPGLKNSLRFIDVHAITASFAASFIFIFIFIPRSNSRPFSSLLKYVRIVGFNEDATIAA